MLMRRSSTLLAMIALIALSACNTSTIEDGSAEAPAAVCSQSYNEPVLNISYAMDSLSGATLPSVNILSLRINGRLVTQANYPLSVSANLRTEDDHLVCSLPCGLGTEEGNYQLMVEAPGYLPQSINVTANYRVYAGGCPSINDQGLHIGLAFESPRQ